MADASYSIKLRGQTFVGESPLFLGISADEAVNKYQVLFCGWDGSDLHLIIRLINAAYESYHNTTGASFEEMLNRLMISARYYQELFDPSNIITKETL